MPTQAPISTTFRDLALALTEEERRSLLRKISASLNLSPASSQSLFQPGYEDQARRDAIMEEIAGLGFWEKLRYFFRKLFSTRNSEQTYMDFRLSELRRRARRVRPSLGPLYPHSVSADVARGAWDLYRRAYAVIPVYMDLWRSGHYLQEAGEHLLGIWL